MEVLEALDRDPEAPTRLLLADFRGSTGPFADMWKPRGHGAAPVSFSMGGRDFSTPAKGAVHKTVVAR